RLARRHRDRGRLAAPAGAQRRAGEGAGRVGIRESRFGKVAGGRLADPSFPPPTALGCSTASAIRGRHHAVWPVSTTAHSRPDVSRLLGPRPSLDPTLGGNGFV